jgi:hypothetical protein
MKKAYIVLVILAIASFAKAQQCSYQNVKQNIQGTWQNKDNSDNGLVITDDTITLVNANQTNVSGGYTITRSAGNTTVKSTTGLYLVQKVGGKTLCFALAEATSKALTLVYPNGKKARYIAQSNIPSVIRQ